jgi:poly(3-hydroxybutyrate) depolymerase
VNGEAREVALVVPERREPNPPLVLFFHGTNGNGAGVLEEGAIPAVAEAHGVVVAAPTSRWLPDGDWDHPSGAETYWDTSNQDLSRNPDLVLVRAVLESSARQYHHDPARVYVAGHSNGAFFALTVAMLLREEVAAFAENSGGLNRCRTTPSCRFRGRGTTCEALASQPGWCGCNGPALPLAVPTTGRRPAAWLQHGTDDNMVSVEYTCALASALRGAGYEVEVRLNTGEGHYLPESFFRDVWPFFDAHRR